MKFIGRLLIACVILIHGCDGRKEHPKASEKVAFRKNQIILRLETNEKVDTPLKIQALLNVKNIGIDKTQVLTSSYLKNNRYQTMVKVTFEDKKFDAVKKQLDRQTIVKDTIQNRIYTVNPFDMEENTDDNNPREVAVEFEASHHKLIHTERALAFSRGEGVVVAVTDTGVDYKHKDLAKNIWHNTSESRTANSLDLCNNDIDEDRNGKVDDCLGWDFANNDKDPAPRHGGEYHGTHVAGIVASTENSEGSVGVAPDSRIMSIKFYGGNVWTSTTLLQSYVYAVDSGAKIINTSFNIDLFAEDKIYLSALEYAHDHDVIVVNSAGNKSKYNPARAELSRVLFVANTGVAVDNGEEDVKVKSSNFGYGIDISAPGYQINSTVVDDSYKLATGTSMSAPVIAGALALIWSQHPEWSKEQVVSRLVSTTDDVSDVNSDFIKPMLGSGRVNLEWAVSGVKQKPISIRGFASEIKTVADFFTLHVKGLVDWTTLNDDTIELYMLDEELSADDTGFEDLIKKSARKIPLSIADREKLSYGSNRIKATSVLGNFDPGRYLLKVNASLRDPFSSPLDGNGDGISNENDNFYKIIDVVYKDHFGPVLNSIELVSSELVTPTNPEIQYRLEVEDDFSGFGKIYLEVRNTEDSRVLHSARCGRECLQEEGHVMVSIPATSLNTNGDYYVRYIILTDQDGKSSRYYVVGPDETVYRPPSHAKQVIAVKDSLFSMDGFQPVDVETPILMSKPILPEDVRRGETLEVKIQIKEDISRIKRLIVNFASSDGKNVIRSSSQMFRASPGREQKVYVRIDESIFIGDYYMAYILVEDEHINRSQYYCEKKPSGQLFKGTKIACPLLTVLPSTQ